MKKEIKTPPKLTLEERQKVECFFYLPGWQFSELIECKSTFLDTRIIYWNKNEPMYAGVYGLNAAFKDSGKLCIGTFFTHYQNRVYQSRCLESVVELIKLLKKERAYDDYEDMKFRKRWNEKQRRKKENPVLKITSKSSKAA